MSSLSKLVLAAQYGRYVDFVPSKKSCHTPVRRSCRNIRGTPHHNKNKDTKASVDDGKDGTIHSIRKTPLKPNALDDLCIIFKQTLKVDNHTLEVKHSERKVHVLSPELKVGRVIAAQLSNDAYVMITPVKRSARNIED